MTKDKKGNALGGSSRILDSAIEGSSQVELRAIDQTIPSDRNISILQLDVEGHEEVALKGALNTIKRCKPILILEVIPQSTFLQEPWFAENILSLGYKEINPLHGNQVFEIPSQSV